MPQLHCSVPQQVADQIRRRAASEGKSVSRFLAGLLCREVGVEDWPQGFFDHVVGGWEGEPLERPRQPIAEVRATLA